MIEKFQLKATPSGKSLSKLLSCAIAVGGSIFGAIFDGFTPEQAPAIAPLEPFLLMDGFVSRYPGAVNIKPTFHQRLYQFNNESMSLILEIGRGFYDWDHRIPLPTDPFVTMPNSRTVFSTISSEDYCAVHLSERQREIWLNRWPNSLSAPFFRYEDQSDS